MQSPPHGSFTPVEPPLRRGHSQGSRLIVTDFEDAGAQKLYEDIYCGCCAAASYINLNLNL
jgi:hypothetical protein